MENAVAQLRACARVQEEVIARLEAYRAALERESKNDTEYAGYANGYAAELSYLRFRRNALDGLILAMEHLRAVSGPVRRFLRSQNGFRSGRHFHRAHLHR
jgi:hypothetical protein